MINTILGVAALIICAVLSFITLKTTHHIEGLEDIQVQELEAITAMKNYTDTINNVVNNVVDALDKQTQEGLQKLDKIAEDLNKIQNDTTVLKRRTEVIKSWYQNEQEGSGNNGVTWANDYPVGEDHGEADTETGD